MNNKLRALLLALLLCCLGILPVQAVTYTNVSQPFNWIDASAHSRLGANTLPYRFNGGGTCGSTLPILDDTISDLIPIGFTFNYGGNPYTNLRISSNGRIQFGDNNYCGYGTDQVGPPQTYLYRYPNANVAASMRIYGADLDPTPQGTAGYTTNCIAGSCYLSYAMIGTAPNRSFVVTWNNVPEWIGTSHAGGNFNLQIILQENGEFIYQYGVNVHGASGTAEIGWQATTVDYAVPGFGLPANNSAIKFYIPRPVAEYRMEQPSWNGTAGEVVDSSGNSRHAARLGTAQTALGRVCRGAMIPSNTTQAVIDGIQTPVNVSTDVGGQGTITFWYKSNSAWNAANSDRQLFDASVAGSWFFLTKRANGRLRFVVSDTGANVRVAEVAANNTTAANTWRHIAVTWNFNALAATNSDMLRIYVDGVQAVQLAFTTGETLTTNLATLVLGDSRNVNSTGQSGTPKSADGMIDEFRIYNFEGGVGLIQRDMAASGCLGHYAISTVAGSTCQATQVTVTAHDAADVPLTMPNNTTMVTLSTSTGRGNWSLISGYGVLNNGTADDGVATYLFNGEYQAKFAYQTDTSGNVNFDVTDGQVREQEDPTTLIAACSVSFNACEWKSVPAQRCVPTAPPNFTYGRLVTKLAGSAFTLDAVALNSGLLDSTFTGTVSVDLLANTDTGVSLGSNNCPNSQVAVLPLGNAVFTSGRIPAAGLVVAANAFSSVAPNYSAYRDVRVRFRCDASNCAPAGLTVCSSDNFAVRPAGFVVTPPASVNNAAQTGSPKLIAGTDFTMAAQAVTSSSAAATGYNGAPQIDQRATDKTNLCGSAIIVNDADKPYSNRVQAHDGTCVAGLSDISNDTIIAFSAASAITGTTGGTFQYHDVGNFRLLPGAVNDATYSAVDLAGDCVANSASNTPNASGLIGCNVANQATSAWFGRFYPDHVNMTSGALTPGCLSAGNKFTYMGQSALGLDYVLEAQSSANKTTSKYAATYPAATDPLFSGYALGYPASQLGLVDTIAINGMPGSAGALLVPARIVGWPAAAPTWSNGSYHMAAPALTYTRPAGNPVLPDGPLNSMIMGVRVADPSTDGVKILNPDLLSTGLACAGNACTHASVKTPPATLPTPTIMRFGLLRLSPAYGSELLTLNMTAQMLYWNGTAFVPNTDDSCTLVADGSWVLSSWKKNLQAGETSVTSGALSFAGNPAKNIPVGQGRLVFLAPGAGNTGSVLLTLNLNAGPAYLQGRWGGAGAATYTDNPSATAFFGINRGPRQVIYRRENY